MYITVNLTGMVIRGFFYDTKLEKMKTDKKTPLFIKQEILKDKRADIGVTILFFIITVLFLYLLYRYLNIWMVIAALLIMFCRIPDLIWEIKNGKKVTVSDRPKGGIYLITDILIFITLPVIWWSLYNL